MTGLSATLEVQRGAFGLVADLAVEPGEVVALVGPNGAGKSTVLRAVAGLLRLDAGRVQVGDRVLSDPDRDVHLEPHQRRIGVVFQDYLLFPHLSVADNVAFGPLAQGLARPLARERALDWLTRMGVADLASARPGAISGGQAQRVALARALATEPELLLLDEPLAALDARTRLLVRSELRRHLADYAGAALVVTHDPIDAAVLADRLVVLEAGRVVQQGTPHEVARRPRTDYVARLVGLNRLVGLGEGQRVLLAGGGWVEVSGPVSGPVHVAFHPAAVSLFVGRPDGSPRNVWLGRVLSLEPRGDGVRVEVADVPDRSSSVLADVTARAVAELDLRPGLEIWVAVKASEVECYPV